MSEEAAVIDRRAALAAFAGFLTGGSVYAQADEAADYPSRPVTVLAPFAAGGTVDIVARLLGHKLGAELKQPFIVENRAGAGGTIATGMLARAAPDGYTLMLHHMGLAFNGALYKLPFDTRRDIAPVAYVGTTPNVLVVTNTLPVHTVAEFLDYARSHPAAINYGSGGLGSAGHLPMEVLQSDTGVRLTHVPYKGSGPAITDLVAGQIQAMLLTIPAVMPFIRSGKLRAIATSGLKRSPALPDLPTIDESTVHGFDYSPWYGFFAPRRTPAPVVAKLHAAINAVLQDPAVAAAMGKQGLEVNPLTREQFVSIVDHDISAWGQTIRKLAIHIG
jgi:tripartite-type tricarboxylate transporter receptor subunit TctC